MILKSVMQKIQKQLLNKYFSHFIFNPAQTSLNNLNVANK